MANERFTDKTDDEMDEELRLLAVTHGGPDMGKIAIRSTDGTVTVKNQLTFDHRKVGEMLNPVDNSNLSVEQTLLLFEMDEHIQKMQELTEKFPDSDDQDTSSV
jgi:hypothetical protein